MPHGSARTVLCDIDPRGRRLLAVAGLTLALCLGCQNDLTRYYPLDPGLSWRYRVSVTQYPEPIRGSADVVNLIETDVLGRTAVPQKSEMFGQTLVRYLAVDGRGVFEFAQQSGDGAVVAKDAPNYVLMVPLADGTTWSSTWQSTQDGRRMSLPTVKAITAVNETVMVPAGTFAGCLRLRITGKADVNLTSGPATIEVQGNEWYAPEVGFIKGAFRETVNGSESSTELGMDLESFTRSR
jgi:hypothetical protein